MVVGSRVRFWSDLREKRTTPPPELADKLLPSPHDAFRFLSVFGACGMCVRRSVLEDGARFDERLSVSEDVEFLHRVSLVCPVLISSHDMIRNRMHDSGSNLSGSGHIDRWVESFLRILDRHHAPENDERFMDQARWLLSQHAKHGSVAETRNELLRVFRTRGWPIPLKIRARMLRRRLARE